MRIGGNEVVSGSCRGLRLVAIKRSDYSVVKNTCYDTYGSSTAANNLAGNLSTLGESHIGFLTSYDAWEGSVTSDLKAQFNRLGLYKANAASDNDIRKPYAAVFGPASNNKDNSRATEVLTDEDGDQPLAKISGFLMEDTWTARGSKQSTLSNIQGTQPSILTDYQSNVEIPNGNLDVTGNLNVGGTECPDDEALLGDGTCGSTGGGGSTQNLSEVLAAGNVANKSIEFSNGIEIGDSSTTVGSNTDAVAVGKEIGRAHV